MNAHETEWVRFEWPLSGACFDIHVPPGYCLRPARTEDLNAMNNLVANAYASDPSWQGQTTIIEQRVGARIRDRISDSAAYFVLAEFDDEIVGLNTVALHSPTNMNLITGVCVDPDHQGKGLGTILLGHSLAWLRNQGLSVATVTTDSAAIAAKIYARFGSVRIANVKNDDPPKRA